MTDSRLTRIPADPRVRHVWIKAELELRGSSFAEIARQLGVRPQNVRAATHQNLRRGQEAIADALDLPVERLFPEWFNDKGERIRRTKPCSDNSEGMCVRNVETGMRA